MDLSGIRKLTYVINTVILVLVFALAGFFFMCHATFLVWFSIPTAMVYIVGYYLIKKDYLYIYTRLVYFWLTFYMCVTTVCLGYRLGFHLYCLSMIPIIFYTEYMADKLGKKRINAFAASGAIAFCYLVATGYSASAGPVYEVDTIVRGLFWTMNSIITISFMVIYSGFMLKLIRDYEKQLKDTALTDRLTGLYNRHYMTDKLEEAVKDSTAPFVAMSDIDDFKKINDQYGHNAGDYVLRNVSRVMREILKDDCISRWGGEEFLILFTGKDKDEVLNLTETVRRKIEAEDFDFEGTHIKVTITSGVAGFTEGNSIDSWITEADNNLYQGKKEGKNKVVS